MPGSVSLPQFTPSATLGPTPGHAQLLLPAQSQDLCVWPSPGTRASSRGHSLNSDKSRPPQMLSPHPAHRCPHSGRGRTPNPQQSLVHSGCSSQWSLQGRPELVATEAKESQDPAEMSTSVDQKTSTGPVMAALSPSPSCQPLGVGG